MQAIEKLLKVQSEAINRHTTNQWQEIQERIQLMGEQVQRIQSHLLSRSIYDVVKQNSGRHVRTAAMLARPQTVLTAMQGGTDYFKRFIDHSMVMQSCIRKTYLASVTEQVMKKIIAARPVALHLGSLPDEQRMAVEATLKSFPLLAGDVCILVSTATGPTF